MTLAALGALVVTTVGCGSPAKRDDAGPIDAGADAGSEPTPPEPPRLTPCPEGWREVPDADLDGVSTCDPWPVSGRETCGAAEAHFVGGAGCERIGTACPAGDFADDLPADRPIVYVRAGEAPGGDGTIDAPFGVIDDAMAAASDGTVVALSKGTFVEAVVVSRQLTLWGACVAQTTIEAPGPDDARGTVELTNRGASELRNLRVTGPRNGVYVHDAGQPVSLESVLVEGAATAGLWIGAETTARDVVVRGTLESPVDAGYGVGIWTNEGVPLSLERVVVERNLDVGIVSGGPLTAQDLAVVGTSPRASDGSYGYGLQVSRGAHTSLDRAVIEGNAAAGILVFEASSLEGRDVLVRSTRDGWCGWPCAVGLIVEEQSSAEIDRVAVVDNGGLSVLVLEASSFVVRDGTVADTRPASNGELGYGLQLSGASTATFERAVFARHTIAGIVGFGDDTRIELSDAVVTGTRDTEGHGGNGISMLAGAAADVVRFEITDNALCGLQLANGGVADLSEGVVSGNVVGVNVQTPDFDLDRLNDHVLYRDNDETLDSAALPIPIPGEGV